MSEGLGPTQPLAERLREMSRRGYWPLLGDEAADEIERLRAVVQICHPPLPVRMVECNVYCATAKGLIEENERLRKALHDLLALYDECDYATPIDEANCRDSSQHEKDVWRAAKAALGPN